jgi:hypothetical protein
VNQRLLIPILRIVPNLREVMEISRLLPHHAVQQLMMICRINFRTSILSESVHRPTFTKKDNVDSIGVAYIGTFKSKFPNKTLLDTGFRLFEEGVRIKAIKKDYKIYGASQFYAESLQNPGREFMNLIETWPQWAGPTYGVIGG